MDAIILYWENTDGKIWSKKIRNGIADRSEYPPIRIANAWGIIQSTNKASVYFKALNSGVVWAYVPEDEEWAQRYRSVMNIAVVNKHMLVIAELVKNKELLERWGKLTDGTMELKTEMITLYESYTEELKKKEAQGERKCNVSAKPITPIQIPECITGKFPEFEYNWKDDRVVHVKHSEDKLEGHLIKYGDKFEDNTIGNGQAGREVTVVASEKMISIQMVYLGEGSGICTLSVASVIYAVLDQANKKYWFPSEGQVYIESTNGCAAFNCYNRAFKMNGFVLSPKMKQIKYIKEYAIPGNSSYGDFRETLKYKSETQRSMAILYNKKEKRKRDKEVARNKLLEAQNKLRKARVTANKLIDVAIRSLQNSKEVVAKAEASTIQALAKYKTYRKVIKK